MSLVPWQKPFRGMQLNKAHPLARGLVACYVMNEGTGDKIFDLSGNGNNGTINGAGWVADGLDFDGSDYVDVARNNLDSTSFSAFVRIKPRSLPANSFIFQNFKTTNNWNGWGLTTHTDIFMANAGGNEYLSGGDDFPLNVWTSWVVTFSTSDNKVNSYVNGGLVASPTATRVPSFTDAVTKIGTWGTNGADSFINEVYIFNTTLSAEEAAWLHREPYAMFQQQISPGLLYYDAAPPTGNPQWYYQMLRRRQ